MKKNVYLQAAFDELVDLFNECEDEVGMEDIHHEMHENWKEFLDAGFDAEKIVAMMSSEDILENLETLVDADIKIDFERLFKDLEEDIIRDNWDRFNAAGVSSERLAERCYDEIYIDRELKFMFSKKVDVNFMLELTSDRLKTDNYKDLYEHLQSFKEHGLEVAEIVEWFNQFLQSQYSEDHEEFVGDYDTLRLCFDCVNDMFEEPAKWEQIGFNYEDYISSWFDLSRVAGCKWCIPELNGTYLPDNITTDEWLKHYTMQEIVQFYPGGFFDFIYDYYDRHGDIDKLVEKIVKEKGLEEMSNEDIADIKETFIVEFNAKPETADLISN